MKVLLDREEPRDNYEQQFWSSWHAGNSILSPG
ncbi:MAG: hypothetical protein ACI8UD_000026 [Planctomycetota bacterium]|jgi:hypothetical protein